MSKAKQQTTTLPDRRILDAVKAVKTALAECRVFCREAYRLYHEAECHPDMPETWKRRVRGEPHSPVSNEEIKAADLARTKVWRTVGYDAAADARNEEAIAPASPASLPPAPADGRGPVGKGGGAQHGARCGLLG